MWCCNTETEVIMKFNRIALLFVLIVATVLCLVTAVPSADYDDRMPVQDPRVKRDHGHGVTGPVHTFVKTDKNANFKWGVRHHVGHHYTGRK